MTAHVLMITDASGSMDGLRDDVIGGQNRYLADLTGNPEFADVKITQVVFNTDVRTVDSEVPLADATRFDRGVYVPMGGTALYDAVGMTVGRFRNGADVAEGDRVLLFITTDGQENSSIEYDQPAIVKLLAEVEAAGWAVVFSGVGPAGWDEKDRMGRGHASTKSAASRVGTQALYDGATLGTDAYLRSAGPMDSAAVAKRVQEGIDAAQTP